MNFLPSTIRLVNRLRQLDYRLVPMQFRPQELVTMSDENDTYIKNNPDENVYNYLPLFNDSCYHILARIEKGIDVAIKTARE